MIIAVDFDGTIVENRYPYIGNEKPFAIETLKLLARDHHQLILWTCREGRLLQEAVEWCRQRGLEFYAVNSNYPEETPAGNPTYSRKLNVDVFIDDSGLCPLPDWGTIYQMITHRPALLQSQSHCSRRCRWSVGGGLVLVLFIMSMLFTSCGSSRDVAYLQNSEQVDLSSSQRLYDARIMPKDQLTITVNTTNPEVSVPFNLLMQNVYTQGHNVTSGTGTVMPYLVDNEGYIKFPVLGAIHVEGLTKRECERMIETKIRPYLSENEQPVVTVQMSSYSISVLGEVAHPGTFMVSREEISIFEALAQAGDLTIYGVRSRVKLIRKSATGHKEIHTLNLNDANIINSPYYYLHQNDIVYVEPNKAKAQNSSVGNMTTLWFSATGIAISLTTLLYNILK